MPGPLFHVGAVATCPHIGGQFVVTTTNTRVLVSGMLVVTLTDILKIAPGCPFTVPGPKPQPCFLAKLIPSTRVFVNGQPAIIYTPGSGICQSAEQIPSGPPIVSTIQTRAIGI